MILRVDHPDPDRVIGRFLGDMWLEINERKHFAMTTYTSVPLMIYSATSE